MEYEVFGYVTHNSLSKMVSLTRNSTFTFFLSQVLESWPELKNNVENISFFWSGGSVSNCKLGGDIDVKNLISVCQISNLKLVSVSISQTPPNPPLCPVENSISDAFIVDHSLLHSSQSSNGTVPTFISQKANRIPFKVIKKTNPSSQPTDFHGKSDIPEYDLCPTIPQKPLLSDSWSQIMNDGIGLEFRGGAADFRCQLIKYSTQMGFKFIYTKNDRRYINAACNESLTSDCGWFIKAKCQPVTGYFVVSKANLIHSCVGKFVKDQANRMSPKIMSDFVVQTVRTDPTTGGKQIIDILNDHYGLKIPYWKAWRTIEKARDHIFGSYDESYDQLRWYCTAIERTNPGSVVMLEPNPKTGRFERLFIGFKACIDGFQSCRPMLFIDGTFMKGRAKGTLLSATAKDGDNGLFPVAFAIVSAENTKNWVWFLEKLRDFIKHSKQVFYISDRHVGLMAAFPIVFEDPIHFFCLFHLLTNLKGRFSKGWSNTHRSNIGESFRECAYAPTVRIFEEKIANFKQIGGLIAEEWLESLPVEKWAVAYSPHITRYGEMTSNAAESFNSWISDFRGLPITYMIDSIRSGISRWHLERREKSANWTGALCPSKEQWWNHLTNKGRTWSVVPCPGGDFEVGSTPSVRVDLRTKSCSCCQWRVRGFPCSHVVAVIRKNSPSVFTYVEECFFTSKYRECYSFDLHPIPQTEKFEIQPKLILESKILPPKLKRKPGRPKKKRLPSYGEQRKRKPSLCPRCHKMGRHDPFSCLLSSVPGPDPGETHEEIS